MTIKPLQQQRLGQGNCGILAIACATAVAYGLEPSALIFCERSMRKHLHSCLESGKMTPFPEERRPVSRASTVTIRISIHCQCHLYQPGKEMVQCDTCYNWFHLACLYSSKESEVIKQQPEWFCKDCQDRDV